MNVVIIKADNGQWAHPKFEMDALEHLGHKVSFLGWRRITLDSGASSNPNANYLDFQCSYNNWKVIPGLLIWFFYVGWRIIRGRSDIVHAFDFEAAFPVAIANMISRTPFIYHVLDSFYLRHNYPEWICHVLQRVEEWIMIQASHIIVVDENRITSLEYKFRDKLSVIYNSPPDIFAMDLNHRTDNLPLVILLTGYLRRNRGVDLILQAVNDLPMIRVLAAGLIAEPDLEQYFINHPQVEYRGMLSVDDALKLYGESDLVCSLYDPALAIHVNASSTKMFDAMMMSKPVLTNAEIKNADLVSKFDFGYITKYGDLGGLKALLVHIDANRHEAAEKGKRGRLTYERHFSWNNMEQRLRAVYDRAEFSKFSAASMQASEDTQ